MSGPSAGFAADRYDRNLERAVMEIVAKRVGDIRGPLAKEWLPPMQDFGQPANAPASDFVTRRSIVVLGTPAVTFDAAAASGSIQSASPGSALRLVPLPD